MNSESPANSQPSSTAQPYELWRPVIRAERRRALERIHHELAAQWSRILQGWLDQAEPVEFEGVGFENFGRFSEACKCAQVAFFAVERTPVAGMLTLGVDLAHRLIESRLGAPAQGEGTTASFSRLEAVLLRQALDLLVEQLGDAYARAGVGRLEVTRVCEQLGDMLLFLPDDYLITFRFRVGQPDSPLKLSIAANVDLISLVKEIAPAARAKRSSEQVSRIAAEIPIGVRVVLGAWRTPLAEIAGLGQGDSIVLPGGEDAWLEVHGRRLCRVRVGIEGRRLIVQALGGGCPWRPLSAP